MEQTKWSFGIALQCDQSINLLNQTYLFSCSGSHTQWSVKALISALPGPEDLSGWAGITQGGSAG